MAKAAAEIEKLAQHELPFDIDHALNQQLKDLAKAVAAAAEEAKKASTQPSLSAAGALDRVKKIRKDLGVCKGTFTENATLPLEYLAKIFPLIEDQARFLDIYAREKDLDGRLKSVQSQNGSDDPQIKAQMRDFEDEQRAIRDDLAKLLDDIDNHVKQLPADPKLDDLRKTAKDFVDAVRPQPGELRNANGGVLAGKFPGYACRVVRQCRPADAEPFHQPLPGDEQNGANVPEIPTQAGGSLWETPSSNCSIR